MFAVSIAIVSITFSLILFSQITDSLNTRKKYTLLESGIPFSGGFTVMRAYWHKDCFIWFILKKQEDRP